MNIQFVNQAQNSNAQRYDFGDGSGVSFEESPVHAYAAEGQYSATQAACPDSDFSAPECDSKTLLVTVVAVP